MSRVELPALKLPAGCARSPAYPPFNYQSDGCQRKDLLNPESEPKSVASSIKDVRVTTISPGTVTGHASAGGGFPTDVEFLNHEAKSFLDTVTDNGKKLN